MVKSHQRKILLSIECALFFFVLPVWLYFLRHQLAYKLVPLMLPVAAGCALYLAKDRSFDRRTMWSTDSIAMHLRIIIKTFIPLAMLMAVGAAFFLDDRFLAFPCSRTKTWLIFLLLYPVLAAYPQELVFRSFFFQRYGVLFPNSGVLILFNSVSFGLAHVVYGNAIAPLLTGLGGFVFAYRYLRTKSLVAVSIEHALWGSFVFTIGFGWYLYSGSIR